MLNSEAIDELLTRLTFIILIIDCVVLYLYPNPVTGMFVITLTGGFTILTQLRELITQSS